MNIPALIIFVIGAIFGGIIESIVFDVGDQVLDHFDCLGLSEKAQSSCNTIKFYYFVGAKILFPVAGGLGLLVGFRKIVRG